MNKSKDPAKKKPAAKKASAKPAEKAAAKKSVAKPDSESATVQKAAPAPAPAPEKAKAEAAAPIPASPPLPRLLKLYREKVVPDIMQKHGYKSPLAVPRLLKITLNMGVGEAAADKKKLQSAMADMEKIAGLKPVQTSARKSIAGFKTRQGYPLGCKVTLRRRRMYDFLDRLITAALPRSRDFRGLRAKAFDGCGNYSLGVSEQIIFHEIQYEEVDVLRGLDISLVTSAATDEEARELLLALGVPIQQ